MARLSGARRGREERGAIIPMVAMLLAVLIPSTAMAVDLGMQRVVRRDMQALADVVALDLVRLVDGRTAAQIKSGFNGLTTSDAAVAKSVERNSDVLGDAPIVTYKLAFMNATTHQLETEVGPGGLMVTKEALGSEVPTAIEVIATGGVDFAFVPGHGGAQRRSVAVPAPSTCFRLGSFAAGVSLSEANLLVSLFPSLINNSTLSATAVGYQGLGALELDLIDLVGVSGLGVGTPDALLELDGLTLGQFYAAVASAVQANGGPTASVTLLQQLSTKANLTSHIAIRDILDIASGDTAALTAEFNVLDLVTGAAYAANGTSSLAVPSLSTQIPGLTSFITSLTVGDQPKLACGGKGTARAQTGQVSLSVNGDLTDVNAPISLPLLGGGLIVHTATDTDLMLAKAEGTLTDIVCGDATAVTNAEGIDVEVRSSLLSTVSTSAAITITGSLDLRQNIPILGTIKIATITLNLTYNATQSTSQGTTTGTISFRHPSDSYGTPKSYGSGIVLNSLSAPGATTGGNVHIAFLPGYGTSGNVSVSSVAGLSAVLNGLLTTAVNTVNSTVVTPLNSVVTPQLQKQLGIKVGGADLFALPRPSCNDPALAG